MQYGLYNVIVYTTRLATKTESQEHGHRKSMQVNYSFLLKTHLSISSDILDVMIPPLVLDTCTVPSSLFLETAGAKYFSSELSSITLHLLVWYLVSLVAKLCHI